MKIITRHEIGFLFNGADSISIEESEVSEIMLSYGGGMGGANQTLYAVRKHTENRDFIYFPEILGHPGSMVVGKRFIVTIEQKKLVVVSSESKAGDSYIHSRDQIPVGTIKWYIVMGTDDEYDMVDSLLGVSDNCNVVARTCNGVKMEKL